MRRSSNCSFDDQLIGLDFRCLRSTLLSKGAWQQITRIEHLCHAQVSHKWLRRMCGKCPDAARLHHQRGEKTWQPNVDWLWRVLVVWVFLRPPTRTRRNLQHRRSRSGTRRMRPRHLAHRNAIQPADIFTTAAVPGRSAAVDVCVAHRSSSPRRCGVGVIRSQTFPLQRRNLRFA